MATTLHKHDYTTTTTTTANERFSPSSPSSSSSSSPQATSTLNPSDPVHLIKNCASAGLSGFSVTTLFNWLDTLRARFQLLTLNGGSHHIVPKGNSRLLPLASPPTLTSLFTKILKSEGLSKGLWRVGLLPNSISMSISSSLRMGLYEVVKVNVKGVVDGEEKKASYATMMVSGFLTGAIAYPLVTPFFQLTRELQSSHGTISPITNLYVTGNSISTTPRCKPDTLSVPEVFRTLSRTSNRFYGWQALSARGAFFTSGHLLGYDGTKSFLLTTPSLELQDGPLVHTLSAFGGALGAATFSCPADLLCTSMMSTRPGSNLTITSAVKEIYHRGGVKMFYTGWSLFLFRLTPVILVHSMMYEQLRSYSGIGYLKSV